MQRAGWRSNGVARPQRSRKLRLTLLDWPAGKLLPIATSSKGVDCVSTTQCADSAGCALLRRPQRWRRCGALPVAAGRRHLRVLRRSAHRVRAEPARRRFASQCLHRHGSGGSFRRCSRHWKTVRRFSDRSPCHLKCREREGVRSVVGKIKAAIKTQTRALASLRRAFPERISPSIYRLCGRL